jgi:4-hydroxybenzoate polyprenyltransferase
MGLLASATYIINDLFDLAADRRHPVKRYRPFAAGELSIRAGLIGAAILFAIAAAMGSLLPLAASSLLIIYLILTLSYSLVLKQVAMMDVLLLAGLFTIRVLVGGVLLPTPISPWLLTFSMLFFLGLAVIKRYAELERVLRTGVSDGRARGYSGRDLPILLATGVSSGISAVVIFTIYLINEQYPKHIYAIPGALWGIMPILLIWTLRAWHLSVHGRMNEDPVAFALRDRVSLTLGALVLLLLFVAWI